MRHWRQRLLFLLIDALLASAFIAFVYWLALLAESDSSWNRGLRYFAIGVGIFLVIGGQFRRFPRGRSTAESEARPRRWLLWTLLLVLLLLIWVMFVASPLSAFLLRHGYGR